MINPKVYGTQHRILTWFTTISCDFLTFPTEPTPVATEEPIGAPLTVSEGNYQGEFYYTLTYDLYRRLSLSDLLTLRNQHLSYTL